jgi:transposase
MAAAIALRTDYESRQLRELAKQSEDADQVRRLLALAVVYDGGSRSDGARAGGVGLQTFRDWVLRFNGAGPDGLVNAKAPGQPPRLDQEQRSELAQLVEEGPIPAVHGVVRWRLSDLVQWVDGDVSHLDQRADAQPISARDGLSEAVGPPTASCAEPRSGGRF